MISHVQLPGHAAGWTSKDRAAVAAGIGGDCRRTGFFFVHQHGIPADLIQNVYVETGQFYRLSSTEKRPYDATEQSQFLGYRGLGRERSRTHGGTEACEQYRIGNPGFLARLRRAVAARDVQEVFPFHFDSTVTVLSRKLGLDTVTPGFGFLDQGGGRLLNSKATFRALAAGTGVAVPHGRVCSSQEETAEFLWDELLGQGRAAIVKQDFHVAGFGNEVISPVAGVEPVGALRTVVTADREELTKYVAERWNWLTDGERSPVVVEHYHVGSLPLCAEFHVGEKGAELAGHGAMRMAPVLNGHVWPAPAVELEGFEEFMRSAQKLCAPIHAMGYRGVVSVDAIVTPEQNLLVNEFNCRVSGSTHAYHIGEHVVGGNYLTERILVEQRRCTFPTFTTAVRILAENGLAYDHATRTGVLVAVEDGSDAGGFGEYCVVAENAEQAEQLEAALTRVFAAHGK